MVKAFKKNNGNSSTSHHDCVGFLVSSIENANERPNKFDISKDVIEQYNETTEYLRDDHIKEHPLEFDLEDIKQAYEETRKLNIGDVIFFEYEVETEKIKSFGKTFYYLWGYSRGLYDFKKDIGYLKNEFLKSEKDVARKVSLLRELFGYSVNIKKDKDLFDEESLKKLTEEKQISKSGKIHFNYAVHNKNTGKIINQLILPRPGTPKPSAYEFYVQQSDFKPPLKSYGDPLKSGENENCLSGRKFYHKALSPIDSGVSLKDTDYAVILKNVLAPDFQNPTSYQYPEFKFTINFENLRKNELAMLLNLLTIDEFRTNSSLVTKKQWVEKYDSLSKLNEIAGNSDSEKLYSHQIGYGKNYGMGAVKIFIDKLFLVKKDNKSDANSLKLTKKEFDFKEIRDLNELKNQILKDIKILEIPETLKKSCLVYKDRFFYPGINKISDDSKAVIDFHSKIRQEDMKSRR